MSRGLMSARAPASNLGVKVVNVFPGQHGTRGLPALRRGLPAQRAPATLAVMDGTRLTHWRTAAASALAAKHLRGGTRSVSWSSAPARSRPFLCAAHASVRRYEQVALWKPSAGGREKARHPPGRVRPRRQADEDLEAAVAEADVISCATLATEPLIAGRWLKPGQHLDLVGAFNISTREADDEALRRAHIYIDTDAALVEGGDVAIGLSAASSTARR